jgi:NAD(P)-dependent dehydrogenase (short-subunit alcohol dehydrogenase family)
MDRYSGRIVLVAGGTGGLGRSVSLAFLEEGAKVVCTYRSPSEPEALRQALGRLNLFGASIPGTLRGR